MWKCEKQDTDQVQQLLRDWTNQELTHSGEDAYHESQNASAAAGVNQSKHAAMTTTHPAATSRTDGAPGGSDLLFFQDPDRMSRVTSGGAPVVVFVSLALFGSNSFDEKSR